MMSRDFALAIKARDDCCLRLLMSRYGFIVVYARDC
jgi:hypothetical protein